MSYSSKVMENVKKYPELKIIDAQKLYKEKFPAVSEQAFYQAVSRMAKTGEIQRISKGIYCKPKKGRFGIVVSSEKNILEYYLGVNKNNGVIIGYQMYNNKGLTTQVSKVTEIYSNVLTQEKKQIKNVLIRRADIQFNQPTVTMIELLEVLQNYANIEDLNKRSLKIFIENAVRYYDEKVLRKVLESIGYKKSTIASLKNIIDFYNIENTLDKYLRGTSKYKVLEMEYLHAVTS